MCFAPQRRIWLPNVLRATTACTFSTSQLPNVVRTWCVLYILTWKCASRHKGVHFFDISTSKSGLTPKSFAFWLPNVLRATTACTFSTSQLPNVVRTWCVLYILTWKCASRHKGVHFFDISTSKSGLTPKSFAFWLPNVLRATTACTFSTSQLPNVVCFVHFDLEMCFAPQPHLATWLCPRRFSEPTFRSPGATSHWKNRVNRDFSTFSRTCMHLLSSDSSRQKFLWNPLEAGSFPLEKNTVTWLLGGSDLGWFFIDMTIPKAWSGAWNFQIVGAVLQHHRAVLRWALPSDGRLGLYHHLWQI